VLGGVFDKKEAPAMQEPPKKQNISFLAAEQNVVDDGFQILLTAGARQLGSAHLVCVGSQAQVFCLCLAL